VASLPSLGNEELEYALDILGFSERVRYLPILEGTDMISKYKSCQFCVY
jgi:hypothetical protein